MSEPTYTDTAHLLAGLMGRPSVETLPDGRKAFTWTYEPQPINLTATVESFVEIWRATDPVGLALTNRKVIAAIRSVMRENFERTVTIGKHRKVMGRRRGRMYVRDAR